MVALCGRMATMMTALMFCAVGAVVAAPSGHADNKRLNDGVVGNVYTVQHQAGCTNDVKVNPQLRGWRRSGTPTTCSTIAPSMGTSARTDRW